MLGKVSREKLTSINEKNLFSDQSVEWKYSPKPKASVPNLKDGGGEDCAGHKNTICCENLANIPTELNMELNEGRELPIGSEELLSQIYNMRNNARTWMKVWDKPELDTLVQHYSTHI